jgi:hypothetical protein
MTNAPENVRLLLLPICLLLGCLVASKMVHINIHKVMLFVFGPNHDHDTKLRWDTLVHSPINTAPTSEEPIQRCRTKFKPAGPHPTCELGPDNVIRTRRQLMECHFHHVVITPLSPSVWSAMQSEGTAGAPLDPKTSPFPVVHCQNINHNDSNAEGAEESSRFFTSSDPESPPCIRPSSGRESGGYAGFISQNYDHLPDMMYFTHGHEHR